MWGQAGNAVIKRQTLLLQKLRGDSLVIVCPELVGTCSFIYFFEIKCLTVALSVEKLFTKALFCSRELTYNITSAGATRTVSLYT